MLVLLIFETRALTSVQTYLQFQFICSLLSLVDINETITHWACPVFIIGKFDLQTNFYAYPLKLCLVIDPKQVPFVLSSGFLP